MAQRIELSFRIVFKELIFFFEKWLEGMIFFNMTQRIELFVWFKELNLFFELWLADVKFFNMTHRNVTQRIELFFFDCDSKILTFFFLMTQRIEPSFLIWLEKRIFFRYAYKNWTLFSKKITPRIELCQKYDTKNWTLSSFLKKSDSKIVFFFSKL